MANPHNGTDPFSGTDAAKRMQDAARAQIGAATHAARPKASKTVAWAPGTSSESAARAEKDLSARVARDAAAARSALPDDGAAFEGLEMTVDAYGNEMVISGPGAKAGSKRKSAGSDRVRDPESDSSGDESPAPRPKAKSKRPAKRKAPVESSGEEDEGDDDDEEEDEEEEEDDEDAAMELQKLKDRIARKKKMKQERQQKLRDASEDAPHPKKKAKVAAKPPPSLRESDDEDDVPMPEAPKKKMKKKRPRAKKEEEPTPDGEPGSSGDDAPVPKRRKSDVAKTATKATKTKKKTKKKKVESDAESGAESGDESDAGAAASKSDSSKAQVSPLMYVKSKIMRTSAALMTGSQPPKLSRGAYVGERARVMTDAAAPDELEEGILFKLKGNGDKRATSVIPAFFAPSSTLEKGSGYVHGKIVNVKKVRRGDGNVYLIESLLCVPEFGAQIGDISAGDEIFATYAWPTDGRDKPRTSSLLSTLELVGVSMTAANKATKNSLIADAVACGNLDDSGAPLIPWSLYYGTRHRNAKNAASGGSASGTTGRKRSAAAAKRPRRAAPKRKKPAPVPSLVGRVRSDGSMVFTKEQVATMRKLGARATMQQDRAAHITEGLVLAFGSDGVVAVPDRGAEDFVPAGADEESESESESDAPTGDEGEDEDEDEEEEEEEEEGDDSESE